MDWVRIASAVKTAISNVTTIFTTTGSEPVAGDVDTIENSNKLIYDEIATLGQIITYAIPVEYRTSYDAKIWRNEDTDYTSGGVSHSRQFYQFATAYDGGVAVLFTYPYRVGSDINLPKSYIYLYDSDTELEIDNKWGGTGTVCKFTYDGEFHIFTVSNPDTGRYAEYIYGADGVYSRSEIVTSIFDYRGMNSDEYKISCINMAFPETFKFIPQQIGDTFFIGMGDKGYWTDENYAVTKVVFFGEPMLMGHGLNSLKQAVYAIGDSYYRVSMYGKMERFKL